MPHSTAFPLPSVPGWSLRRRLLILTVSVTAVAWLVGGAATFFVSRHISNTLFDHRLRHIAEELLTFADHEITELQAAGAGIVHVEGAHTIGAHYRYQIWSPDGRLLLVSVHTGRSPFAPLRLTGFSTGTVRGVRSRIVVIASDDGSKIIEMAEPLSSRSVYLVPDLPLLLIPLLISLAVPLGFGAWMVRAATGSLDESALQLRQRSPDDLRPLPLARLPLELMPIVAAINTLFSRIENALAIERSFTAAAAHELRTPLANIKIQAQVASRTHDEVVRQQVLARLASSIDRTSHMVDQLLTMSRIDGLIALRAQAVRLQLDAVAAHVIDEMRSSADRRSQTIVEEFGAADVEATEFGVAVLVRNLLDNAIRYTPVAGTIRIRTGTREGWGFLAVDDSGPGIPESQRQQVFERFFRLPDSGADGCGIGLSIVRAVVEMHGAAIALAQSDLGGLRILVEFPPVAGDSVATPAESALATPAEIPVTAPSAASAVDLSEVRLRETPPTPRADGTDPRVDTRIDTRIPPIDTPVDPNFV